MERFELITKRDDSFEEGSEIYGDLFCKVGKKFFPSEGWTDIISSVLCMWMDEIGKMINTYQVKKCGLPFMEGPYEIQLRRLNSDKTTVLINFLYMRKSIDKGIIISLHQIAAEINRSVNRILKTPPTKGQEAAYRMLVQKYEQYHKKIENLQEIRQERE